MNRRNRAVGAGPGRPAARGSLFFRRRGFSLVEMALLVVLLGVVAGLSVPSFSRSFADLQLRESADQLAYMMRYAQSRSVLAGKTIVMAFDDDGAAYRLKEVPLPGSEGGAVALPGKLGRRVALSPGIEWDPPQEAVRFYPDGTMDEVRIVLRNQQGRAVTVSTAEQIGYVNVYKFEAD